jgi:hypothetical protein
MPSFKETGPRTEAFNWPNALIKSLELSWWFKKWSRIFKSYKTNEHDRLPAWERFLETAITESKAETKE